MREQVATLAPTNCSGTMKLSSTGACTDLCMSRIKWRMSAGNRFTASLWYMLPLCKIYIASLQWPYCCNGARHVREVWCHQSVVACGAVIETVTHQQRSQRLLAYGNGFATVVVRVFKGVTQLAHDGGTASGCGSEGVNVDCHLVVAFLAQSCHAERHALVV